MEMPFGIPVPAPLSPAAHRFQVEAGMSLTPKWAREFTGFDTPELVRRAVHHPALQAYARAVRWAFGTPPYARLAQERVAAASPSVPAEAAA
jgi:uncharacterized protein (DUF2236 family)